MRIGKKAGVTESYDPQFNWVSIRWDDGGCAVYGIATFSRQWRDTLRAALEMGR